MTNVVNVSGLAMKCDNDCLNCKLDVCKYDLENGKRHYHIIRGECVGLGKRLKDTLDIKGMTQADLSALTGITIQAISHYVNDKTQPKTEHVVVMCRALQISADWLLGIKVGEVIRATYGEYSGVLYGESSMSIYNMEGREVLHTGSRNPNIKTKDDLIEHLKKMPEFMEMLNAHWEELQNEVSEDDI